MKLVETNLPGCVVIEPQVFGDERGFFYEAFNHDKLAPLGLAPIPRESRRSSACVWRRRFRCRPRPFSRNRCAR